MKKFSLLLILALISPLFGALQAQQVTRIWPGDVNNDGVANEFDVLFWGAAFGAEGPERPAADTIWTGQPIGPIWNEAFPGGLNFLYADCNGDGEVDFEDLNSAIFNNFGLIHGSVTPPLFSNGTINEDPPLRLNSTAAPLLGGETIDVALEIGTEEQQVEDFYGIAFQLRYTPGLVNDISLNLASDSWITQDDDEDEEDDEEDEDSATTFLFNELEAGIAHVAITRLNQIPITGNGSVGNFSIVIEDIIFNVGPDTLVLEIDSIKMVSETLQDIPVSKTASVRIRKDDSVVSNSQVPASQRPLIHPNPSNGLFHIRNVNGRNAIERVRIFNSSGQLLIDRHPESQASLESVDCSHLAAGIYFVSLQSGNRTFTQRLILD